ncbi:hypothetical protein BH09BAC6_BH09BAC6_21880 [soil metagenome]|jgi:uncharacterized membrane protein
MGGLGAPEIILIFIALTIVLLPAVWGYNAGSKRTIGATGGLLLGLFLSLFGVLIVYCTNRVDIPFNYNNFSNLSTADELQKFKQLLDSGAITEAEYNQKKAQILNK